MTMLHEVAECDAVLAQVRKQKNELFLRRMNLEAEESDFSETASGVNDDLQAIQIELDAVNLTIASVPEGEVKRKAVKDRIKLEYKLFSANNRKEKLGSVSFLMKQYDLARVGKELDETESFIQGLEAHKTTL